MLVLHPSSTCDVCLDSFVLDAGYPDHRKAPCAIECGHVFCRPCLESLQRRACPLCRTEFDRETVRKLHVDIKPLSPGERLARPDAVGAIDAVDAEKEDLKARIVSMIREGAEGSAYQAFLQQTKDWLREQDQDEHWDLRGPYLLLIRYHEMHKEHQVAQMDVHELSKEREELRLLLAEQTEALQNDIEDLRQALVEERVKASAVEKSLKDHHARMETAWSQKYDDALNEIRSLREEQRYFSYNANPAPRSDRIDIRSSRNSTSRRDRDPPLAIQEPDSADMDMSEDLVKLRADDERDMSHFSPLPAHLSPFHPALNTFSPLCKPAVTSEDADDSGFYKGKTRSRRDRDRDRDRDADASEPMDYTPTDNAKPLTIAHASARFYESSAGATASSSLPHPAPATYYSKRHEKQREHGAALSRNHSSCSSSTAASKLRHAANTPPPDLSDIEAEQRERRQRRLEDILADPAQSKSATPSGMLTHAELEAYDAAEDRDREMDAKPPIVQQELPVPVPAPRTRDRRDRERERDPREQPNFYVNRTVSVQQQQQQPEAPPAPPSSVPPRPTIVSHASAAAEALERERERRKRESGSSANTTLRDATNAYAGEDNLRRMGERRVSERSDRERERRPRKAASPTEA